MRNSPFSFALLILIILFYALCQCHPARAQTVSDLDLITTLDLTLTDKLYLTNVEATGSAKDKSVTLSQLVTLFGPTIEVSGSNITSGTIPDARFPSTLPALNGSALTALNASEITSGLLPNARLDTDLAAIAALTTTTYGRSLLAAADAAGLRTLAGLGSLATQSGTFSGTSSGTNTGDQDLSAYLTSAAAATAYQPLDSDLTAIAALATTSFGRGYLTNNSNTFESPGVFERTDNAAAELTVSSAVAEASLILTSGDHSATIQNAGLTADRLLISPDASGTLVIGDQADGKVNLANGVTGTLAAARLATSGVTAGSYTSANVTIDQYGRITSASNGSGGGITIGTTTINGTAGRVLYTDGSNVQQYATTGTGDVVRGTSPTITGLAASSITGTAVVGATGSTDNAILRADGTGGGTAQGSLATITDVGAPTFFDKITVSKTGTSTTGGIEVLADPLNPGVDALYLIPPQTGARMYMGKSGQTIGSINYQNANNENFGNIISTSGHYQIIGYGGTGISILPVSGPLNLSPAAASGVKVVASYVELDEMSAPSAPGANKARLYLEDNGSGKSRLMVLFPSGAPQQAAIEP